MADGSAAELETQLLLVKDLYPAVKLDRALALLLEVEKMLTSLMKSIGTKV